MSSESHVIYIVTSHWLLTVTVLTVTKLFLVCIQHAGISIEESKSHISLFPFEEIDTAFLFIHALLHNPASDNVCP